MSYIGETGRKLDIRVKEHRKEVDSTNRIFTRHTRTEAQGQFHKSAITDHTTRHNHLIDWDNVTVKDNESNRLRRWIKESIQIRANKDNMNRDIGSYTLSHVWDRLVYSHLKPSGGRPGN